MSDRRLAAVEKSISDIQPTDVRVALTGTIVASGNNRALLDDGTGQIMITADVEVGQIVRVVGRVIPSEAGIELSTEFVQPLPGLDLEFFKKVSDMWRLEHVQTRSV